MKRKAPIEIGQRAVSEAHRLFPDKSDNKICQILGCSKHALSYWREGTTPGAVYLARLYNLGADVIYILTGGKNEK